MHYHYDIAFLTGKWPALDFQERKCEQVRSLLLLCSRPTPWILHFFLECSLPRMHSYHNFHHSAFLNITVHIAALPICKTCNIFLFVVHKVQVLLIFSLKQKKKLKDPPGMTVQGILHCSAEATPWKVTYSLNFGTNTTSKVFAVLKWGGLKVLKCVPPLCLRF